MAIGSQYVLFSGQQGIQHLIGLGTVELLYLTVAKWVALVVAFATGWRGGPVFPLFFAVSSLAVLVADPLGVAPEILMIAGIAAISAVFLRGSVPAAFVLSLYVVPLAHAAVILIGALGAASALTVARGAGILPVAPDDAPPPAPAV
jgi:H+/Cl- antiporter ClcA